MIASFSYLYIENASVSSDEPKDSERKSTNDPLYKLFQKVFINDSWSCVSLIEKPYYFAEIFFEMCYLYGDQNAAKTLKTEQPLCV
ncbi:8858_t:CDS:2, partial [Cetraspora pellucida]